MSALALLLCLCPAPVPAQEAAPALAAPIKEVTVYRGGAFVRREASVPAGAARVLVRGLPAELDRDALRVRCAGAEVVGVDASDRLEAGAPEARLEELRAALQALEDRLAQQGDEGLVLDGLAKRVESLLRAEERLHAAPAAGAADPGREERLHWIEEQLLGLGARRRDVARRMQATQRELEDARLALGRAQHGDGTRVVDLAIELAAAGDGPATLEVEYLVARAGWTPVYDLRAPKDLSKVELVYRANVVQGTGEDWTGVELVLSTAEPRRGAAGPQPYTVWLDLARPRLAQDEERAMRSLGYSGAEAPASKAAEAAPDVAARVEDEGLTVRYRIPRPETIESRSEPSSVLIGRADLKAEAERVVVPALDTTVWLRAHAVNTSDWVLLPGRAAVYFGADFLGHSELAAVQRNAEFTLHLGADPGLQVERIVLAEKTEEAGVFSSRETFRQSLRFKLRNTGALSAQANGAVTVALQESIPRSNDERVSVEIAKAKPEPAGDERWKKLREEHGVATWLVSVPRGEERTVELETEITYPEEFDLVRW